MADRKRIRKILLRLLEIVFSVALLAMLAASLILAKPQDRKTGDSAAPSAQANPAVTVSSINELASLDFPVSVLCFNTTSGMTFNGAVCADAAVAGGFGRTVTTKWLAPSGEEVSLKTIWPADALELLGDGFHFMPYAGPTFSGSPSVRMENDQYIRLHATKDDEALYEVLIPRGLSKQVQQFCGFLTLYTTAGKEP